MPVFQPAASGDFLCAPRVYAPASPATPAVSSATLAAFDATNICTSSFIAPPTGNVLVNAQFQATMTALQNTSFALGAHGTVTPVVGNVITIEVTAATGQHWYNLDFPLLGLTPGNSYRFDLLGAIASGTATITAVGQTSVTPTGQIGGPVIMTVRDVQFN